MNREISKWVLSHKQIWRYSYIYCIAAALAVLLFFLHRLLFVVSVGFSRENIHPEAQATEENVLYCIITAAPKLQYPSRLRWREKNALTETVKNTILYNSWLLNRYIFIILFSFNRNNKLKNIVNRNWHTFVDTSRLINIIWYYCIHWLNNIYILKWSIKIITQYFFLLLSN